MYNNPNAPQTPYPASASLGRSLVAVARTLHTLLPYQNWKVSLSSYCWQQSNKCKEHRRPLIMSFQQSPLVQAAPSPPCPQTSAPGTAKSHPPHISSFSSWLLVAYSYSSVFTSLTFPEKGSHRPGLLKGCIGTRQFGFKCITSTARIYRLEASIFLEKA